jgi:dTDP-4-dehydrorhamnose reductase
MEMRVLVLGHNGMLGHMVSKFLLLNGLLVETTDLRWPSNDFKDFIRKYNGDYIINCIGAIHQRTNEFDVNWELPIFLDFYSECRVINPGTDCEMDDDNYGTSKRIARDFIVTNSKRTKSIKTSILGPEKNTKSSLMEWFLSNKDNQEIFGYSQYFWNGNTTLTWSEIALDLIKNWNKYSRETIVSSECISKKEILVSLNDVFKRNIIINNKDDVKFDKCLIGNIQTPHIKTQLQKLKEFYYDNH